MSRLCRETSETERVTSRTKRPGASKAVSVGRHSVLSNKERTPEYTLCVTHVQTIRSIQGRGEVESGDITAAEYSQDHFVDVPCASSTRLSVAFIGRNLTYLQHKVH